MSGADWIEKAAKDIRAAVMQQYNAKGFLGVAGAEEIIRQAYAAHCQTSGDVNGLAERIAEAACDHAPDFNHFGGADFKSHVTEMLAPLLAENERRLKLLVECRGFVAGYKLASDTAAEQGGKHVRVPGDMVPLVESHLAKSQKYNDLLTRIDAETGGK